MSVPLSSVVRLKRRYTRSVNLERDLAQPEALAGYVPTRRALDAFRRIASATEQNHTHRAWTLTGVYGTGKSAFAHFLAIALGPEADQRRAGQVLAGHPEGRELLARVASMVGPDGFVRAIATAKREPIAHTVLRALAAGAETYWASRRGRRPSVAEELRVRAEALSEGRDLRTDDLPELVRALARASGSGVLLVLDEMGKNLEAAAHSGGADDLYLLQRLAEIPIAPGEPPVIILGLLHQAFVEYGTALSVAQRAEWDKVQGRFEDLPFAEAPEETLRLVSDAIEADLPKPIADAVSAFAAGWRGRLNGILNGSALGEVVTAERLTGIYPLHPVAALVLPVLCSRYAQNDRSLFTFLTSPAQHSLASFLVAESVSSTRLPLLGLPAVFDYFLDGGAPASRPQFQRWSEVHALVRDAPGLSEDDESALKTIGTFNLIASSGALRASRGLVLTALVQHPGDPAEEAHWAGVLDDLAARRLVVYRSRIDEYRLWEGSDYDAEAAVQVRLDMDRRGLAEILESVFPMAPVVAPRHSYQSGTLRYFERRFADQTESVSTLCCRLEDSDGLLIYWVSESASTPPPAELLDGRPVVLIAARGIRGLDAAARELAALQDLESTDPTLAQDGVAKREVRQRALLAHRASEAALREAFAGAIPQTSSEMLPPNLGAALSVVCDRAYPAGPVLWNEMLNRRELTAQGARARRVLIEMMLASAERERLGLSGDGPEYAMYASVLLNSGIHHRDEDGQWCFGPPSVDGIKPLWDAVEAFCLDAVRKPRTLDELYAILARPPYGVKPGVVPVILAAVLLYHMDDVSIYRDGTFLPQLGPEHFELLIKNPSRFAVKHLALSGIRWELFKEIADSVSVGTGRPSVSRIRNATLLGVVRPLVRFVTALPPVTRRARDLSPEAAAVRDALTNATEPDQLIFETLPMAVGLQPFIEPAILDGSLRLQNFRRALFRSLRELETYYERLLEQCRGLIHEAFGVQSDPTRLREDLRVRCQYLLGRCVDPMLKRLTAAAIEADRDERNWLEAIVMVVADRPAETWTGDDRLVFELNLAEVARRFGRLEALLREAGSPPEEGFDARRIAVTNADGKEFQRIVWIDRAQQDRVALHARRLADEIRGIQEPHLREAIALSLLDHVMNAEEPGLPAESPTHKQIGHG